jgi:hypothetical protein
MELDDLFPHLDRNIQERETEDGDQIQDRVNKYHHTPRLTNLIFHDHTPRLTNLIFHEPTQLNTSKLVMSANIRSSAHPT